MIKLRYADSERKITTSDYPTIVTCEITRKSYTSHGVPKATAHMMQVEAIEVGLSSCVAIYVTWRILRCKQPFIDRKRDRTGFKGGSASYVLTL